MRKFLSTQEKGEASFSELQSTTLVIEEVNTQASEWARRRKRVQRFSILIGLSGGVLALLAVEGFAMASDTVTFFSEILLVFGGIAIVLCVLGFLVHTYVTYREEVLLRQARLLSASCAVDEVQRPDAETELGIN